MIAEMLSTILYHKNYNKKKNHLFFCKMFNRYIYANLLSLIIGSIKEHIDPYVACASAVTVVETNIVNWVK